MRQLRNIALVVLALNLLALYMPAPACILCGSCSTCGTCATVVNGDFEGSGGFETLYGLYAGGSDAEGLYSIGTDPHARNINWSLPSPDTGRPNPGSNMMMVNGSTTAGVIVWKEQIRVKPCQKYVFSYYLGNLDAGSLPEIKCTITDSDGTVLKEETASAPTTGWTLVSYDLEPKCKCPCARLGLCCTCACTRKVTFTLVDTITEASGNDFALDDITLTRVNTLPTAKISGPCTGWTCVSTCFWATGSCDPDGCIKSYEWDWDNDQIADKTTKWPWACHSWKTEGTYTVNLRVQDDDEEWSDWVQTTIEIKKLGCCWWCWWCP
jgi:hypothetical protein